MELDDFGSADHRLRIAGVSGLCENFTGGGADVLFAIEHFIGAPP